MAVTLVRMTHALKGLEPAEIADKIADQFLDDFLDIITFGDQVSVIVKKGRIFDICRYLHDEPTLSFDHLQDLTAVDYLGKKDVRFEVVYNLYSIRYHHKIRIRAQVYENDPKINSVVPIWAGANWHERECFDMFGIVFIGHPDLRRILLPEDWEGHPLRKDYPTKGPEKEWSGFTELVEYTKKLQEFEWKG
jgi:NADH-quinone oxidoreductase subunit C